MTTVTKLKPAPFKVGDVVEYLGERYVTTTFEGKQIPMIQNGMRVTIAETYPPRIGYGFIKTDDDGEDIIDRDEDGYNVYKLANGYGRIIWAADKKEWRKVK